MQTIRSVSVPSPTWASVKSWPGVWAAGPELTGIAAHRSCKPAERRIIRHVHQWTSAPRKRCSLTEEGAAGQRRWCDRAGGTDQSHMLLQLDSAAPGCRSKLVNMYYFFFFYLLTIWPVIWEWTCRVARVCTAETLLCPPEPAALCPSQTCNLTAEDLWNPKSQWKPIISDEVGELKRITVKYSSICALK